MLPAPPHAVLPAVRRRAERAFTIVEVVVASMMLMIVTASVSVAVVGESKTTTARDVRSRTDATMQRAYEHLNSDRSWIQTCVDAKTPLNGTTPCDVSSIIPADIVTDDTLGITYQHQALAAAVDSAADGLGTADTDETPYDFFRITVTLTVPVAERSRLGVSSASSTTTTTTTIYVSDKGDNGALIVQVCAAENQIDERIQISGCEGTTNDFEMPTCGDPSDTRCPWKLPPQQPASDTSPTRSVRVKPHRVPGIRITHTKTGTSYTGTSTNAIYLGDGKYEFSGIRSGTYQVSNYGVAGYTDWATHHIPSSRQATVEKHRTANALIMLQRPASSRSFTVFFKRNVYERNLEDLSYRYQVGQGKFCPMKAGSWNPTTVICHKTYAELHINYADGSGGTMSQKGNVFGFYRDIVDVFYIGEKIPGDRKVKFWNGAAVDTTLMSRPEPHGRYVRVTGAPGSPKSYEAVTGVEQVRKVPQAAYNARPASPTRATIEGLPAGLNRGVLPEEPAAYSEGQAWGPAGCVKDYIWVASDGSLAGCTTVTFTGTRGECYTSMKSARGGVNYSMYPDACSGKWWPPINQKTNRNDYFVIDRCRSRDTRYDPYPMDSTGKWVKAVPPNPGAAPPAPGPRPINPAVYPGPKPVYKAPMTADTYDKLLKSWQAKYNTYVAQNNYYYNYTLPAWNAKVAKYDAWLVKKAAWDTYQTWRTRMSNMGLTQDSPTLYTGKPVSSGSSWKQVYSNCGGNPEPKSPTICTALNDTKSCDTNYVITYPPVPGGSTGGPPPGETPPREYTAIDNANG